MIVQGLLLDVCAYTRRSPGGTPMNKRDPDSSQPASNDPAAVIAQALRRKFAHNVFQDSPGMCMYNYLHQSLQL